MIVIAAEDEGFVMKHLNDELYLAQQVRAPLHPLESMLAAIVITRYSQEMLNSKDQTQKAALRQRIDELDERINM